MKRTIVIIVLLSDSLQLTVNIFTMLRAYVAACVMGSCSLSGRVALIVTGNDPWPTVQLVHCTTGTVIITNNKVVFFSWFVS